MYHSYAHGVPTQSMRLYSIGHYYLYANNNYTNSSNVFVLRIMTNT